MHFWSIKGVYFLQNDNNLNFKLVFRLYTWPTKQVFCLYLGGMLDNESFWMSLSRCCQYVLRLFSRYLKETQVGLLSLLVLGLAGMVGSPSIRWSKIIWWYPSLWWSRSHYEWKYWLWWSIRILWSPSLGHPKGISIGSMDFDNP